MNAIRRICVKNTSDIVPASMKGREIARQMGFSATDQSRISLVISELARIISWNTTAPGEIVMSDARQNEHRGLEIACLVSLENMSNGDNATWAKNSSILWRSLTGVRQLADESMIEAQDEKQARVMLTKWRT